MKIIFIGSVYFSKVMLEKLINLKSNIVGVITKEHSAFNSDFEDLSLISIKNNIPFLYTENINNQETIFWIKKLKSDIIFCFGWSSLIKKDILELCPMGVLGFHPALIPNNRGRHPLIWAKILGLEKSGTTFFFMDEGADSGDILDQKEFKISFEDNAASLYNKMIENSIEQLKIFIPKLTSNNYPRTKQNQLGNSWRKRNQIDGLIDFRMTSESICNLVRGLSKPYFGAHCIYKNKEIKVWEIELSTSDLNNFEPGKVLDVVDDNIKIKTSNGSVILINHNFETIPSVGKYIK